MSSLQEEERLRPLTQTFVHRRHSIPVGFKFQWRIRWFGKQREVRKEKRKHVFQGKGKKKAWKEYWTEHQKNWLFGLDLVLRGWLTLDKPTDLCGVKLAYVCEEEVGRMTPRSPSALICLETKVSVVVFFFFFFFLTIKDLWGLTCKFNSTIPFSPVSNETLLGLFFWS